MIIAPTAGSVQSGLEFTIWAGNDTVQAEGLTRESVPTTYLVKRRSSLLSARDPVKADQLFSDLPKKAEVSGGGTSKAYRVRWEKVGRTKFQGSRFVFSPEETGLGRFFGALRRRR